MARGDVSIGIETNLNERERVSELRYRDNVFMGKSSWCKLSLLVVFLIIFFGIKDGLLVYAGKTRGTIRLSGNGTLTGTLLPVDWVPANDTRARKSVTPLPSSSTEASTSLTPISSTSSLMITGKYVGNSTPSTSFLFPKHETPLRPYSRRRYEDLDILKDKLDEFKVEPFTRKWEQKVREPIKLIEEKEEGTLRNKNIGQKFEVELASFNDKLQEKRALFGLVGLALEPYAYAEQFAASWSQVIVIKNPFTREYVKDGLNTLTTECYAPNHNITQNLMEIKLINEIKDQCENSISVGRQATWYLMESALSTVDRSVAKGREKRGVALLVIGIVAVLSLSVSAGSVYAAKKAHDNAERLEQLVRENQIKDGESVAIRDQLLGLTAINEEKLHNISKHFSLLAVHQSHFKQQIKKADRILHHILHRESISEALFLNLFSSVNNRITGLGSYQSVLQQANRWMDGHIALRHNRLPVEMVDRDHLRQILEYVSTQLPNDLVLALSDLEPYYSMPLVNHHILKDDIYLKLTIPLKRRDKERKFMLFHVQAVPFRCGPACSNEPELSEDSIVRMNMKPQLWAYDLQSSVFYTSVEYLWTCTATNQGKQCFTLKREAISLGDNCFRAIMNESLSDIYDNCEFITSRTDDARPIPIGNRKYLVLPFLQPELAKQCERKYRLTMPHISDYGTINVGPECRLIYRDEVILYEELYSNVTVELALEKPLKLVTLYDLRNFTFRTMQIERVNFSRYVDNLTEIKDLTYDNRKLTRIIKNIHSSRQTIAQRLISGVEYKAHAKIINAMTFLQISFELIAFFMLYLIVFTAIRSGNFIFLLAPTIIINSETGFALESNNLTIQDIFNDALNATVTVSEESQDWFEDKFGFIINFFQEAEGIFTAARIEKYLQATKLSVAFLLVVLTLYWSRFRMVYLNNYRGRVGERNMNNRFYVMVEFTTSKHRIAYTSSYKVTILVPIVKDIPADTVALQVVNPLQLWYTSNRVYYFCATEQARIRGLDSSGHWTCELRENIQISFSSVHWFGNKPPFDVFRTGHGSCIVTVVPDPHDLLYN